MKSIVFVFFAALTLFAGSAEAASLGIWLRADQDVNTQDNSGLGGSASAVTSWGDQSGNENHVVQGIAEHMPRLVSDGLNGAPVVRFYGEGHNAASPPARREWLSGLLASPIDLNQATSFFVGAVDPHYYQVVLELSPTVNFDGYIPFMRQDGSQYFSAAHFAGTGEFSDPRLQVKGANADSDPHVYVNTVHKPSSSLMTWVDGIDGGASPYSNSSVSMNDVIHYTVGAGNNGSEWWLGGDIAEILVFDEILTSDEIAGMTHILGQRWSLDVPIATSSQIAAANALLPIPEPTTAVLVGLGLIGLSVAARSVAISP